MNNNKDDFRFLREQREEEERIAGEKQQTISKLNEQIVQNQDVYKKIVEEVLAALRKALYPDAKITGPAVKSIDWEEKYALVLDILSYNPRSVRWNRYGKKLEYLRALGSQEYLEWEIKPQNQIGLQVYVGLINYKTIGFIIDNFQDEPNYDEFSRENFIRALTRFYSSDSLYGQESLSTTNQEAIVQKEVSVKLTVENWRAISRILAIFCQSQGQDWVDWQQVINQHITRAIDASSKMDINKSRKQLSQEDVDAINDAIVSQEAEDVYDEFSEYLDDD